MTKTITYNKIQKFILEHIKTRLEYTDPQRFDPFTTDYARNVMNLYVRFVYAKLGNLIKPCKRVTSSKCFSYLLWLRTSANRFIHQNSYMYDFQRIAEKHPSLGYSKTIEQNIMMFQEWFIMEFKWEVGIV